MAHGLFPERIETDRLALERLGPDRTDPFAVYDLVSTDAWLEAVTEHMPWYRFGTLADVAAFLEDAASAWADREKASYAVRPTVGEDRAGDIVGLTAYGPEWETRRAGSGIVLARDVWGQGYGRERAGAFVELTFERFDLDAFYATVADGNERSRHMIEAYVDRYGGRHEGLLRQHSPRPDGTVTDQHRYTITRAEYRSAIEGRPADEATLVAVGEP